MEDNKYVKYYCATCGRWLGIKLKSTNTDGILPYCSRCKRNVKITTDLKSYGTDKVYKCQSAYK